MTGTSARSVIDVVDPVTGQPVGTAERGEALAAGLPIRTVHIFLFDDQQRLLLQVLGRERDRHALLRGSSVACFPRPGVVDLGVSTTAGARREMRAWWTKVRTVNEAVLVALAVLNGCGVVYAFVN